jgi:hypothetical protein
VGYRLFVRDDPGLDFLNRHDDFGIQTAATLLGKNGPDFLPNLVRIQAIRIVTDDKSGRAAVGQFLNDATRFSPQVSASLEPFFEDLLVVAVTYALYQYSDCVGVR